MSPNAELVEGMIHAYFHGDADKVLASVTDDFRWVNLALPRATIKGRDMLAAKLAVPNLGLPLPLEEAGHQTSLVLESVDRLMHERIDRLRFKGQWVEIPCAAAFELRDGKISAWRDYYDIGHVLRFFERLSVSIDTSHYW